MTSNSTEEEDASILYEDWLLTYKTVQKESINKHTKEQHGTTEPAKEEEPEDAAAMRLLLASAGLLGSLQYAQAKLATTITTASSTKSNSTALCASLTQLIRQTRIQCDEDSINPLLVSSSSSTSSPFSSMLLSNYSKRLPLQKVDSIDLDEFFEEYPDCCRLNDEHYHEKSDSESSSSSSSSLDGVHNNNSVERKLSGKEKKQRVSPTSTLMNGTDPTAVPSTNHPVLNDHPPKQQQSSAQTQNKNARETNVAYTSRAEDIRSHSNPLRLSTGESSSSSTNRATVSVPQQHHPPPPSNPYAVAQSKGSQSHHEHHAVPPPPAQSIRNRPLSSSSFTKLPPAPPPQDSSSWEDHCHYHNPFQTAREYVLATAAGRKNNNHQDRDHAYTTTSQQQHTSYEEQQQQQHHLPYEQQQRHPPCDNYGYPSNQPPNSFLQQQQQQPEGYPSNTAPSQQQQHYQRELQPGYGKPVPPPSHGYNPYRNNNIEVPPPQPAIRESLKRKFQPPKKGAAIIAGPHRGGGATSARGPNNNNNSKPQSMGTTTTASEDEDDLPEELKRFGKDLVEKIENEIMESGDSISFDQIAGLADQKQTVQEVVCWPMKRPDLFTGLRRAPNGLLLYGPPGTGKTLIGKAIAHESGATFFSISSSSLTSKWIGEGEKLVRVLFAVAAYRQPAVVFIDEIDSLLTQRKADENEASRRIKTEFLVQLDGTGTSGQGRVLVIGATNRPQELDEAARRRFTKRLYIPLPEEHDREILIRVLLQANNHILREEDILALARDTQGFSGADLKALSTDAAMGPIRQLGARALEVSVENVPPISYKHFRQALKGMRPSVSPADLVQYIEWDKTFGSKRAENEEDSDVED